MLKTLLRVRMSSLAHWLSGASRVKKKQSRGKIVLFALLMLYAAGAMAFAMYGMFTFMAEVFHGQGLDWLYFAMYVLADFALMFIGSVFIAKAQLFEAKDNELLLSMPIKPEYILISRMIMLLVINYAFDIIVSAPALAAWLIKCPMKPSSLLAFAAVFLALPFFALALSSLLGWLISRLTSRSRHKSLMTTVFSVIFMLLYFLLVTRANTAIYALVENGRTVAAKLGTVAPIYWAGAGIAGGGKELLLALLCMVIPFIIVYRALTAAFIRITTVRGGAARIKYTGGTGKIHTVSRALFSREMRRFLSSSAYVLNAGMGVIIMLIAAVALIIKNGQLAEAFGTNEQLGMYAPVIFTCAIGAMCGMITISAPSVSMEGRSMWITRSMPVSTREILLAKLKVHVSIAAPAAVILTAAAAAVSHAGGVMGAIMIIIALLFSAFTALAGLCANLKNPSMEWVNETQAVKSGVGVLISIAVTGLAALVLGGFAFLLKPMPGMLLFAVVLAVVCIWLYSWVMKKGVKIYEQL